jgi:tetratricopeptide (TPR) repeat protein
MNKKEIIKQEIKGDNNSQNIYKDNLFVIEGGKEEIPLDKYIEVAESKLSAGDYINALSLFNDALIKAKAKAEISIEIRAVLGNAECYFYLKDPNKAIKYSEEAIKLSNDSSDKYYLSISNMILAQVYEAKGDLKKAFNTITESQKYAIEHDDDLNTARISLVKARYALKMDMIEEANELIIKYSNVIKERGGKEEVLAIELEGIVDILNKDIINGEQKIACAILKAKDYNLYETAFALSSDFGKNLIKQKRFNEAKTNFEDTIEIAGNLDIAHISFAKLYLAEALYFMKDYNDALQISTGLISIAGKNNLPFIVGESYLLQSAILMDKKEFSDVYHNIQQSFEYFNQINDVPSFIRNLIMLGDLCLETNIIDYCVDFVAKYDFYKKSKKIPQQLLEELHRNAFQIHENIGEYDKAISILNEVSEKYSNIETDILERINNSKSFIESKKNLSTTFNNIIQHNNPLELAGTNEAQNIYEANRWVLGPLLDWVDGTAPFNGTGINTSGLGLIYDLWGQANFSRLVLNLRAFPNLFHLCIEVTSVEEAREACKTFLPLTDCLTLIWKGNFDIGTGFIPRHLTLGSPQKGWVPHKFDDSISRGYPITVAPLVCCCLPFDIVDFYVNEARPFIIRGKLILAPGPMVGCTNTHHSILEEIYCQTTNGFSIQNKDKTAKREQTIPFLYPYFSEIDFDTLSKIVDDEEEGLRQLRITLLEWTNDIQQNGFTSQKKVYFKEKIKEMINPVTLKFNSISKNIIKSENAHIIKKEIFAESMEMNSKIMSINTSSAFSSSILWSTFREQINDLASLACFRLMGIGKKWDLHGPQISIKNPSTNEMIRPEMFNWLKIPGDFKTYMVGVKDDNKGAT